MQHFANPDRHEALVPARSEVATADVEQPPDSRCVLCARLHDADEDFVAALRTPERVTSLTESIVDAFGFCAAHGPQLLDAGGHADSVRSVLHDSLARIIDLLADEVRYADRLQVLFFGASAACPGCRQHDHRATHAVRAAAGRASPVPGERLCFPHYRQVAYAVDAAALPAMARAQLRTLHTAASVGSELAAQAGERDVADDPEWHRRFAAVLGIVAGERIAAERAHRGDAPALPAHAGHAGDAPGCPVCAAVREAHADWLAAVRTAARVAADAWIVFPTCAAHIRECGGLGDPGLGLMVANYGASVATRVLERGIVMVDADNEKRRVAAESVWYRRQSPAYILGQQRKMVTRMPRCPGCERAVVARERAVATLVRGLRRAASGSALAHGRALCLKHFAAVYLLLPPDGTRTALVGAQLERLAGVRGRLAREAQSASVHDDLHEALRCLAACA